MRRLRLDSLSVAQPRSRAAPVERVVFVAVDPDCGLTDSDATWLLAKIARRQWRVVSSRAAVRRAAILADYAGTLPPDPDSDYDGVSVRVTNCEAVDTAFDVTYHAPTRTLTSRPGVVMPRKRPRCSRD